MKAIVRQDQTLRFIGTNELGHETIFDTSLKGGGLGSAASPMDILLEATAACSSMDVVGILQKQRRTLTEFRVELDAERAEEHPKVFTSINMHFVLVSPDAQLRDLTRAIHLSHSKYCSVSITVQRSGCPITWTATLRRPDSDQEEVTSSAAYEAELVT